MMKKSILGLAVISLSLGIAGCNTSTSEGNDVVDQTPIESGDPSREASQGAPIFNVARQELPLATDFLFSGSEDGTLVFPAGEEPLLSADGSQNPAYNPVFDALNDLDGFSTTGQLFIPFNKSLSDISDPRSAFLVPLDYADVLDLETLNTASPFDLEKLAKTSIQAEVVSYADGSLSDNVLRISPLSPLESRTRYLVVLTNQITDSSGDVTSLDNQYEYLLGDGDLLTPALAPARDAMRGWYTLAQAFVTSDAMNLALGDPAAAKLAPTDVTLAYTITTGSRTEVLSALAAPGVLNIDLATVEKETEDGTVPEVSPLFKKAVNDFVDAATDKEQGEANAKQFLIGGGATAEEAEGLAKLLRLPIPSPRTVTISDSNAIPVSEVLGSGSNNFVTGRIKLPLYSSAPVGAYSDDDVALNPGESDNYICQTNDLACAQSQGSAVNTVAGQWQADTDVIFNLTGDETQKAPSDNITGVFPFAKEQGIVDVPVTITLPDASCPKPYKSVIYQHGITSNRFSTLVLGDQLGKTEANGGNCFATIAIDLPLHGLTTTDVSPIPEDDTPLLLLSQKSEGNEFTPAGTTPEEIGAETAAAVTSAALQERHFALTADGVLPTPMSAEDGDSGSLYITFLRFQATRDNNRQAVMDLLNLAASIPYIDLDGDFADGRLAPANPANGTNVDEYVFYSTPEGQAAAAAEFGATGNVIERDFDENEIYFVGVSLGSIIGTQFVAVNNTSGSASQVGNSALPQIQSAVFAVPGGGLPKLLENSVSFAPQIVGGLTSPAGFNLTQGGDQYESLLYTYQATVDSADPISFGPLLKASQTPYTLIEAIGDKVVPNNAPNAPLAGTDPLISVFGAEQVDASTDFSAVSNQNYFRLVDELSNHSSVAAPDLDDSTPEGPETFGFTAQYIVNLFKGTPSLVGGEAIIEAAPAE